MRCVCSRHQTDDFLQANEVEKPKAVAYALMEVPPHATGMPKEQDYQPLKPGARHCH